MPAYVIGKVDVTDADRYKDYAAQTQATLEPFGGRFIVRGPQITELEGSWDSRVVVIEFPDRDSAQGWWDSEAYEAIKPIRREASTGSLILVDGYTA